VTGSSAAVSWAVKFGLAAAEFSQDLKVFGRDLIGAMLIDAQFSNDAVRVGTCPLNGTEETAAILSTLESEKRAPSARLRPSSVISIGNYAIV